MTTPKKNWFERHQGFITFIGYLATVLIGSLSLYLSNSKSTDALDLSTKAFNLSNKQFQHQRAQDSLSDTTEAQTGRDSKKRFKYQDSLNKRQDAINEEQLKNFKSQTLTAKEQLKYFKKQTQIAETQLKNADLVYQNQLNENAPIFTLRDLKTDSTMNKPHLTLRYNLFNSGKRTAYVNKILMFVWNPENNLLEFENPPAGGDALLPSGFDFGTFVINEKFGLNVINLYMFEIFYKDILLNKIMTYRIFTRLAMFNPIVAVQIDNEVQNKFILRIGQAEMVDNKKYLSY